jgi:hypothetical protein
VGLREVRPRALREERGQTHRLFAQLAANEICTLASQVAFVEPEVEHLEHRVQARREFGRGRQRELDAMVADLALGADEALRDRRFLDQERPSRRTRR